MDPRITKLELGTSLTALKDLFLPRGCVVCGRQLLPQEKHICLECLSDLPLTRFSNIRNNPMADRYNACLSKEDNGFEPYAYATALFYYDAESGYGKITQALKYHRDIGAGAFFSHMLGKELMSSELFRSVDTIIPVPLHWTRKLKRGYNQADVIAKELSTLTGALCLNGADNPLIRTRRTGSQTRLGAKQRANNVKGAFRLRNDILTGIEAKHILLVDDVFTTGATITSCHQILRSMLPEETRISAATLAFVTD